MKLCETHYWRRLQVRQNTYFCTVDNGDCIVYNQASMNMNTEQNWFKVKEIDKNAHVLLAMFDTYPASKCTTQNMYTRVCAGVVVIVSLRTALGSLKEERKKERKKKTKMNNLRGRRFRFITLSAALKVSSSSEN